MTKNRRHLARLVACLGALLLMMGLYFYLQPGLYVDNDFFRRQADGYRLNDRRYVLVGENGFEVCLDGAPERVRLTRDGQALRFLFEDGETVEGCLADGQLVNAQGMPLWMEDGRSQAFVQRVRLCEALARMSRGETEARAPYLMLLAFALVYAVGAFSFLAPDRAAFFLQMWRFEQAELSDMGRWVERAAGALMMLFGAAMLFAPLWIH